MITNMHEITFQRKEREKRAAEIASTLEPGDYYADGNNVMRHGSIALGTKSVVATECASHWDACLVLLALGNRHVV